MGGYLYEQLKDTTLFQWANTRKSKNRNRDTTGLAYIPYFIYTISI